MTKENILNNDLWKNIIIFFLIVFIGYLFYCECKNKKMFKKLNENMTNVEKFTGESNITESIKNLGLLATKIQGADGVLDLTGIDLKVNNMEVYGGNLKVYNPKDKQMKGVIFWNTDFGGLEIKSSGSDNMRLFTGSKYGIDITEDKIQMYKNLRFNNPKDDEKTFREIQFENGSVIKEGTTGLILWPRKNNEIIGNNTGEVHMNGYKAGDKMFPGIQTMKFIPIRQEVLFNLNSTIKEFPENGVEIWSRNKNGSAPLYAKSTDGKHISLDNRGGYGYIESNDSYVFGPKTFNAERLESKSAGKRHYNADGSYKNTQTIW